MLPNSTPRKKVEICLLHADRPTALKGENIAIKEMRKHASRYLQGLYGGGKVRTQLNECETRGELTDCIEKVEEKQRQKAIAKAG